MRSKPETIAYLNVQEYCFTKRQLKGIVKASQFKWQFTWSFGPGILVISPPLGRALIENSLLRFLLKKDYELEAGCEYKFVISAKF
tara:strand:- start:140 stop:397 length:258 start_codon:yes stop_codon:yes gene_type:complete